MVVTCPECGTRFSLEESRISGAAARVRCSRCKHIFRVTREGEVVGPEWQPPALEQPETVPEAETQEEAPPPAAPEPREPEAPAPEATEPAGLEAAPPAEEEPQPTEAAAVAEVPVPHKTPWLEWGLVAFILLTGILGGLVWRYSQGKPLLSPLQPMADIVQQLQGWWQPREQPASVPSRPPASVPTPAKQVVTPPPPPAPSPGLETLPVDWAEARYRGMVNAKGGQLLVIQGEVTNEGKAPRGPIRLKATLTDAQHRPMKEEMVYIGTTLTDQELKALDPGKIRDWLTQPGGRSQVKVLKPGEKQPFTVVFFGVPDNLAEAHSGFQLVVVEGPAATSSP